MKIKQISSSDLTLSAQDITTLTSIEPHLIFIFASIRHFEQSTTLKQLIEMLSPATIIGCSTAGEIHQHGVLDHGIVITAIHFKHPDFILAQTTLDSMSDSYDAGHRLAAQLQKNAPKNVLVFGQGVDINGSALIEGLKDHLPQQTIISGGLAGDNGQFDKTFIIHQNGCSSEDIVAIGFFGEHIQLATASFGGWKGFGTTRQITRHESNILYELDNKPALELYKRYLGDYADDLPSSGLLFPFSMLTAEGSELGIIRTILGVNEQEGSLILAGDLTHKGYLQLMHASTDALIDGAEQAASVIKELTNHENESLAILVSCVGRKLLMGGRVDEEVDAVATILGQRTTIAGFYSNGEISPFNNSTDCKLHNQTMTITYLSEI